MSIDHSTPGAGLRSRHVAPTPPAPVPAPRAVPAAPEPAETIVDRSGLTTAPAEATEDATAATAESGAAAAAPAAAPAAATATATAVRANGTGNDGEDQGGDNGSQPNDDPLTDTHRVASDTEVVRSTGSMAIATLLSRITGFIRTVMIGSMLGTAVGSAFQVANTLPNLITEIVLGSVMTSLVVPVLVRAEKEDPDRGAAFIRRLFTLTVSLLTVVTFFAVLGAPFLTRLMLRDGEVNVVMSTSFAYLVLPQIFFYGLFSLFMAVLNTKGIFRPGAWAPVANNLVSITVLMLYSLLPGSLEADEPAGIFDPHVLLIGLGTTLGVVVQCLIMVPSLKKAGIDLRPLWGIDARLKQFGGMALAIIVYVAISQAGYVVTTNVASLADAAAPLIYSNSWLLLQVPYGVIGVTLLTAIMPRLSRNAADGDDRAVVTDLTLATKLTFIALIPVIIFFTGFGVDIAYALFQYGSFGNQDAELLGLTLSFSAFTLIPYALVMLHLRVFYARENAWTPTFIVAGITATKIVLSLAAPLVAASPANVVILLGAANGFGYLAGAVIGAFLLRRKLGSLQFPTIARTSIWALAASLVGLAAAIFTRWILNITVADLLSAAGSIGQLISIGIIGIVFLIVTGVVLSRSDLPEVQNLGRLFARIPVIGKFIRIDESKAIDVGDADEADLSAQIGIFDAFNASPTPPPMSAGVVRGPRLVPGAPVSDGRFRLLAEHGSVQGAQFWKAREQATGEIVGLTFVDTSGQAPLAPRSQAEMARTASAISTNTRRLADLDHEGIAENIRILSYRSGCLIVTDWVEGSSLRAVAETAADPSNAITLNPAAVAKSLAPLAEAAAAATAAGTPLGLDNSSRLRIDVDGEVVLAFPAVLPSASRSQDASSLASAIKLLSTATSPGEEKIDEELAQIVYDARAVANETDDDPETANDGTLRDLARRLRVYSQTAVTDPDDLDDTETPAEVQTAALAGVSSAKKSNGTDAKADSEARPVGFGSSGYTPSGTALVSGAVIVFVVLVAAATTLVTSLLSGDSENAPVNTDSIQGSQASTAPRELPIIFTPDGASVWQAPGQEPTADNPEDIAAVIDDSSSSAWTSGTYPNGLGTKPGIGVALTMDEPIVLSELEMDVPSNGARYSVYELPFGADPAAIADISSLTRLAAGTVTPGINTVELDSSEQAAGGVLVWFTELAEEEESLTVEDLSIIGHHASPADPTSPEAPAASEAGVSTP